MPVSLFSPKFPDTLSPWRASSSAVLPLGLNPNCSLRRGPSPLISLRISVSRVYVNLPSIARFMKYCRREAVVSKEKWWLQIQPLPKTQKEGRSGGHIIFCSLGSQAIPDRPSGKVGCFSFTRRNIP